VSGSSSFSKITKLELIFPNPTNIIDWTNQFINFQNQTFVWPDGVQPSGSIQFNFTGLSYQVINITGVVTTGTSNLTYQIFKIEGLEN